MKTYAAKPRCHCCNDWFNWAGEARAQGRQMVLEGLEEYFEGLEDENKVPTSAQLPQDFTTD